MYSVIVIVPINNPSLDGVADRGVAFESLVKTVLAPAVPLPEALCRIQNLRHSYALSGARP
jgi:hypothetical protein